jgi:hypothetical protein
MDMPQNSSTSSPARSTRNRHESVDETEDTIRRLDQNKSKQVSQINLRKLLLYEIVFNLILKFKSSEPDSLISVFRKHQKN